MSSWRVIQTAMSSEHRAFLAALKKPLESQLEQLKTILRTNQDCAYGCRHSFASIDTIQEYQQRVPVVDYEQLSPMIERMVAGETSMLCQEPLACFEMTGGSSTGPRMIPYTESSLAAMRRALYPWLSDLATHQPGITRGTSYWAISPAMREKDCTAGGVPIGMPNDAVYFGSEVAIQLEQLLAAPMSLAGCRNLDSWRYLTLRHLISNRTLSLVSVWSPSFLLDLLHYLDEHISRFVDDIAKGQLSIDATEIPASANADDFAANPTLALHLQSCVSDGRVEAQRLWPQLNTLSCWTDGSARLFVPELQQRFPNVNLQGKGLLATEGCVSLPISAATAPVLALRSGFHEFEGDDGCMYLCTELVPGQNYEVILTSHAGLYRYRLGDRVRCAGYYEKTPLLTFVGRAGLVSDICGEKLREDFVLQQLGKTRGFTTVLASLEPQRGYILILDDARWSAAEASEYAAGIERDLQRNPQYRYARSINQLTALAPLRVHSPWRHYADYCHSHNRLQGDLKPPALSLDLSLLDYFKSKGSDSTGVRG